jgi:hypothetical protein
MGGLECVITGITDEFKVWFKRWKHGREIFMFVIVFISFLISIINVTRVIFQGLQIKLDIPRMHLKLVVRACFFCVTGWNVYFHLF